MPSVYKAFSIIFAISLAVLIVIRFECYRLPGISKILPQSFQDPIQTPTDNIPLNPERKDGKFLYEVVPMHDYELFGVVASKHLSQHDIGMYDHAAAGDHLNSMDLCVIWGENIRSGVYRKMKFSNDDWSCQASFKRGTTQADWKLFNGAEFSNNHLLPGNFNVDETLAAIKPGDQIHLRGKLVRYKRTGSEGNYRGSSTLRTDTGNGACEIIYVTGAKILKPANEVCRIIYDILKIFVLGLGSVLIIHYLGLKQILQEWLTKEAASSS